MTDTRFFGRIKHPTIGQNWNTTSYFTQIGYLFSATLKLLDLPFALMLRKSRPLVWQTVASEPYYVSSGESVHSNNVEQDLECVQASYAYGSVEYKTSRDIVTLFECTIWSRFSIFNLVPSKLTRFLILHAFFNFMSSFFKSGEWQNSWCHENSSGKKSS